MSSNWTLTFEWPLWLRAQSKVDDTPPLGVMALWPFDRGYYFAHAYVFEAISRRYWLDNFVTHNAWAVIKEVLMLGPLVAIVFAMSARWRGRRRFRRRGTT